MRQRTMHRQVELEAIDRVPGNSRVAHYDELGSEGKEQFFELAAGRSGTIRDDTARELERYDVVKFTDYYRVTVT